MQTSPVREKPRRLFQVAALLVPSLFGAIAIAALMIHQERLVVNWKTFSFQFQEPPIYVEEPTHEVTGYRYLFDEELGWRNIPNWTASTSGRRLTINSKGLRDHEYPYEKPPGKKRVLVLGDSYTWGYGVENDAIFTEVLERLLEKDGKPWEVLNSGVSGYGTDQEYLWFKREGVKYQPDLVVVAFFVLNDPNNNIGSIQYSLGKPVFLDTNLTRIQPPVLNPGKMREEVPGLSPLDMSVSLLRAIQRACAKIGARLLVMKFGFHGTPPDAGNAAFDSAFKAGVTAISDTLYFDLDAECENRNLSFYKMIEGNDDGHWNAYGHKLVGEMLHDFLDKNADQLMPQQQLNSP